MTTSATLPIPSSAVGGARGGRLSSVLVAVNGQDGTAALRMAQLLAAPTGAEVTIFSAIEPDVTIAMQPHIGLLTPEYEELRTDARRDAVRRQIRDAFGGPVAWPMEVVVGPAPAAINAAAQRHGASLIIMGRGRHDPVARLLAGETVLRTVRRSDRPVLAVADDLQARPRVAVVGMDFSPSSIAAARCALDIVDEHATVYLVHVWSRSASDHPSERARDEAYEAQLPELFSRAIDLLDAPAGVTVKPVTLLGAPAKEILWFAESQGADLIAAGKQGHGFFERLLVGSVTTRLLRAAASSVLVTPLPPIAEADELSRRLTGSSMSTTPDEWIVQLDGFSRRNHGRRVVLEIDDPSVGGQAQVTGYALLGAVYDHRDHRVQLMLGNPVDQTRYLTHMIEHVNSVIVRTDREGHDVALQVMHEGGSAQLTFLPTDAR